MRKRVAYSDEVIDKLCELLESGKHLSEIGKLAGMPNRSTLYKWCERYEGLAARIAHARNLGFDERAERAVHEARTARDPAKARLAFDAERWLLSKMNPARYGERQLVQSEISGPGGKAIEVRDDAQLARELDTIMQNVRNRRDAELKLANQRRDADDLA